MQDKLIHAFKRACKDVFSVDIEPIISRPDEQFGDYTCNVAMQLGKQMNKNPREVANALKEQLKTDLKADVSDITIAGPGFINLTLKDSSLVAEALKIAPYQHNKNKQVLVEFGNFNPLKTVHLGHLYTTVVASTIARLFSRSGAKVHQISYHGDVGMHIAKAIWAIGKEVDWDVSKLSGLQNGGDKNMQSFKTVLGSYYAHGSEVYDSDPVAAEEIRKVNKEVYNGENEAVTKIHKLCVKRSMEYFDTIYDALGVTFETHYMESETAPIGTSIVKDNIGKVFEESDGAVVYKGEKDGLHTRVFLNSEGLPTYEAKDMGLIALKERDYPGVDHSIIITGNEQNEYFKVMLAALSHINPKHAAMTEHISHGLLSLTTGKMSSRTGNVFGAQSLMDATRSEVAKNFPDSDAREDVYLAALKYTFLKHRIGGDIVFDVQDSVSLDGNSGPYIQYAYARAKSILRKKPPKKSNSLDDLEPGERCLVRKLGEYEEVLEHATKERLPHHICTYLYELAQEFNRFYEKNRVIDNVREAQRLQIVQAYANVLKDGLETLGIPAPEKM